MKRDTSITYGQTPSEKAKDSRHDTTYTGIAHTATPRDVFAMPQITGIAQGVDTYRDLMSGLGDAATLAMRARKLYLTEKGFYMAVAKGPVKTAVPRRHAAGKFPGNRERLYSTTIPVRKDQSKDYVFRCGDYYLPLSFEFSGNASKRIIDSQLVDGPAAIEVVNKQPKTINVTVRIQPNYAWGDVREVEDFGGRNMTIEYDGDSPQLSHTNVIAAMLNELYETNAIFEISNKFLNENMGVNYVLLERYNITPQVGSRMVTVQMDLRAIYVRDEQVKEGNPQLSPTPTLV